MKVCPFYICLICIGLSSTASFAFSLPKLPDFLRHLLLGFHTKHPNASSLDPFDPSFMDRGGQNRKDNTTEGYQPNGQPDVNNCDKNLPNPQCDPSSPYRTYDATCNNLAHPTWGMTGDCHLRFLTASYEGAFGVRKSVKGKPLPPPRDLTLNIFTDKKRPTHKASFMFTVFGQMVAHEITNTLFQSVSGPFCPPKDFKNASLCIPIEFRDDDPFYSQFNITSLPLTRSIICPYCNNGKRQQPNAVTAVLDLSLVYGSTEATATALRANDGTGKLLSEKTVHGELLPKPGENSSSPQFCPVGEKTKCFIAGDGRVNQHATLTSIQTIWMRNHNRIAGILKHLNPHWDGEILYQEARRIVAAQFQYIVYSEYLPSVVGPSHMCYYNLSVKPDDQMTRYNPDIQIGIWDEFSTAAFRLHSMIPTTVGYDHHRFKDYFSNPEIVRQGKAGPILRGACKVASEMFDHWFVKDVTDYLYQQPRVVFGEDLVATDIQRGRDHGIPTYADILRYFSGGKVNASTFEDLAPLMSSRNIKLLKENYLDVDDIDLWVGIHMEHHVKGSVFGPTACAIVAEQFYTLKFGDRFFFEHQGEVHSFSPDQLKSLKESSLSRILCDNTEIQDIQRNSLLLPSVANPVVNCDQIPQVDFNLWKISPN